MTLASTLADAACVHDAMLHARARLLLRAAFALAAYETACVPLMCARAPIAQTSRYIDHGHRGSRSPSSASSGLRRKRTALPSAFTRSASPSSIRTSASSLSRPRLLTTSRRRHTVPYGPRALVHPAVPSICWCRSTCAAPPCRWSSPARSRSAPLRPARSHKMHSENAIGDVGWGWV